MLTGNLNWKAGTRRAGDAALSRYSFRRLATSELPLLNALYNTCYRSDRPLEEAVWLYEKNPNGRAVVFAAFADDGELAGVRPAIPWRLVWRGQERSAYEFADALVAPRHRNRRTGLLNSEDHRITRLLREHLQQP